MPRQRRSVKERLFYYFVNCKASVFSDRGVQFNTIMAKLDAFLLFDVT